MKLMKRSRWNLGLSSVAAAGLMAVFCTAGWSAEPNMPKTKRWVFSFHGHRMKNPYPGALGTDAEVALSAKDTEGKMTMTDEYWNADFDVPPHFHTVRTEIFYYLEGHAEWTIGGETHEVGPGDVVMIPPNTIHSVHTTGGKKCRVIMIQLPGGYEQHYVEQSKYTVEQLKDPAINRKLDLMNDFNEVEPAKK